MHGSCCLRSTTSPLQQHIHCSSAMPMLALALAVEVLAVAKVQVALAELVVLEELEVLVVRISDRCTIHTHRMTLPSATHSGCCRKSHQWVDCTGCPCNTTTSLS
jgi:hypothetical protein